MRRHRLEQPGTLPQVRPCPMFEPYLTAWSLVPDGEPIVTRRRTAVAGASGMASRPCSSCRTEVDERLGGIVMAWWAGEGAARVLARDGEALLLERAMGRGLAQRDGAQRAGMMRPAGSCVQRPPAFTLPSEIPPPDLTPLTHVVSRAMARRRIAWRHPAPLGRDCRGTARRSA